MGFFKKVFRPIRKVAKKIIPKEIRPALPYLAAFYGGPAMAGSSFMSGIGNTALRNAISKGLISGATAAGTDENANILRTAALGAADADEFAAAFDIDGAADGAYAPSTTPSDDVTLATADTLDLTFAGSGATFTAGKIRVYAWMVDVSDQGDSSPSEVDRDALA